jgi:hypothetical protein
VVIDNGIGRPEGVFAQPKSGLGPALSARSRANSMRRLLPPAALRVQSRRSPTRRLDQCDCFAFTTVINVGTIIDLIRFTAEVAYGLGIAARPWLLSATESSVALPPVWSIGMPNSYGAREYRLLYLRLAASCRNLALHVPDTALQAESSVWLARGRKSRIRRASCINESSDVPRDAIDA